jgi:hypothetical protein
MVRKNPIDFEPSTSKVTGTQNRYSSLFRFRVITFEQIDKHYTNIVGLFSVRENPIDY